MSSNDGASDASVDGDANADASGDGGAGASASEDDEGAADTPAAPSVPEGFGEPPADDEGSRWGGYALAGLLAVVFLIGLVRVTYPNLSILVIGTLLALFGLLVGVAAVWNRITGS